jgi:hypothetical protein
MQYADASEKLAHYRQQIADLRGKMRELQQSIEPEEVNDYEFSTTEGKVRLSVLFGDKEYLFVIQHGRRVSLLHLVGRRFQRDPPAHRKSRCLCRRLTGRSGGAAEVQYCARMAFPNGVLSRHRVCS